MTCCRTFGGSLGSAAAGTPSLRSPTAAVAVGLCRQRLQAREPALDAAVWPVLAREPALDAAVAALDAAVAALDAAVAGGHAVGSSLRKPELDSAVADG